MRQSQNGKITLLFIILLIIIGVIQPISSILDLKFFIIIGDSLVASPAPSPLTGNPWYENYVGVISFEVELQNGSRIYIPITNKIVREIKGPHKRKVVYYNGISRAPLDPFIKDNLMKYIFCTGKPFQHILSPSHDLSVNSGTLYIHYSKNNYSYNWSNTVYC